LGDTIKKYAVFALLISLALAAGVMVACSPAGRGRSAKASRERIFEGASSGVAGVGVDSAGVAGVGSSGLAGSEGVSGASGSSEVSGDAVDAIRGMDIPGGALSRRPLSGLPLSDVASDSLAERLPDSLPVADGVAAMADSIPDTLRMDSLRGASVDSIPDSLRRASVDSIPDSLRGVDSLRRVLADSLRLPVEPIAPVVPVVDTAGRAARQKAFLDHPVLGKAQDSLVYDVRNRLVFTYGPGELTYQDDQGSNLKADHMRLNATSKEIFGVGQVDTVSGQMTRPEFVQGASNYTMDTITYNLDSKKAKIKGVATRDGEGFLLGRDVKKMPDNTVNIAHAKYTTCDIVEHPHFYIEMTKAKVIPGKKIITGPAYFVMEDVPVYFLGIPGGFFPMSAGPQSGIIMPSYGEEARRGFYLRNGGYYFTFGDYADLALTGDIYTLGSWAANIQSNYVKRYKFSGNFSANYSQTVLGEKNTPEYQNNGNFRLTWSHRMDPKAKPGTMFSASVNFVTAGFNKNATTTLADHLNTQTNSSISYSKSWTAGSTPINLTVALNHSSNSRDSTISLTLPNISFSVGSFAPFKRRVQVGKLRWWEKITMSYSMSAMNQTGRDTKERDLFTAKTLDNMLNGVSHSIPVKTSFNLLGYITFSPSFNYKETWNFQRKLREYNPLTGNAPTDPKDIEPDFGFFRAYNWDASGSFSTKLYMRFTPIYKPGKEKALNAVRWVITPTVGATYSPDFRKPWYGFNENVQTDSLGRFDNYSPYIGSPEIGEPPIPRASINFSLSNQLEAKVRDRKDTTGTGTKKIPIIEQLSASGSYNFMLEKFRLSNINLTLRTGEILPNISLQLSAVWDPYLVVDEGGKPVRVNKLDIGGGRFGRITSTGWSFGYTFNSSNSGRPAMNDINSGAFVESYVNPWNPAEILDPAERRRYMVTEYYDFTIPWNFGFQYSMNYSDTGLKSSIIQTLNFNGSVNLTDKWGVMFSGGVDMERWRLTPMSVNITRDLHCWQMTFQWIPFGHMKSYMFHIGVLSGMLADIKYDKQSSQFDNLME
jgi:hypothetical protein